MMWWARRWGGVRTVYFLSNNFLINKYARVRPYPSEIAPHGHSHARSIERRLHRRSIELGRHRHSRKLQLLLLLQHWLLHLLLYWLLHLLLHWLLPLHCGLHHGHSHAHVRLMLECHYHTHVRLWVLHSKWVTLVVLHFLSPFNWRGQ